MFIPFNEINPEARIWIYQADRQLQPSEKLLIQESMTKFCSSWQAHNKSLKSSFSIAYDQFLTIAVEEDFHNASGCSIDNSVHYITAMGQKLNIDFLNRSLIAFIVDDKVQIVPLPKVKKKIVDGEIKSDDLIFNNNILTKKELETSWLIPVKQSWARKYLDTAEVQQ